MHATLTTLITTDATSSHTTQTTNLGVFDCCSSFKQPAYRLVPGASTMGFKCVDSPSPNHASCAQARNTQGRGARTARGERGGGIVAAPLYQLQPVKTEQSRTVLACMQWIRVNGALEACIFEGAWRVR